MINSVSLDVQGASCASCVLRIETALNGVHKSTMNLANGRAKVSFLAGAVDMSDLVSALQQIGYDASQPPDGDADAKDQDTAIAPTLRVSLISAAILTLPVFTVEMGGHIFPAIHTLIAGTIGMQTSHIL